MVHTREVRADIQRALDKLEKWGDLMKLNLMKKYKVLQLGRNSLKHQYRSSAGLSVTDMDKRREPS